MIINESNREELSICWLGESDEGVLKAHEPRAPSTVWARESVTSDPDRDFVTSILQEPFKQGLVYDIPMNGLEDQEDIRAENPGPDGKGGINMDNLLEESQEKEETQAVISWEIPHSQDPDLEERSGEETQELHAHKPPPPEYQKAPANEPRAPSPVWARDSVTSDAHRPVVGYSNGQTRRPRGYDGREPRAGRRRGDKRGQSSRGKPGK